MKRRSFIQSLMAVPVVAVATRFVGHAAPSPNEARPAPPPRQSTATLPIGKYKKFRAVSGIRKGSPLREFHYGDGVVAMGTDYGDSGGWFVGVAMHDAMAGDSVIVMTEGTTSVSFQ